jgi:hypothetical protein
MTTSLTDVVIHCRSFDAVPADIGPYRPLNAIEIALQATSIANAAAIVRGLFLMNLAASVHASRTHSQNAVAPMLTPLSVVRSMVRYYCPAVVRL